MKEQVLHVMRLSAAFARASFLARHAGSYLGFIWYALNPLAIFTILYIVFSHTLGADIVQYPLYLLIGVIVFNLFRQVTVQSARQLYQERSMVQSVRFPHAALIGGIVLEALYGHVFEFIILVVFIAMGDISMAYIAMYPLLVALFGLFILGVSLCIASLSSYLPDTEQIWAALSQALWFMTPIFYAVHEGELLFTLNLFNPLYFFIQAARELLLYQSLPGGWLLISLCGYTIGALSVGIMSFRLASKRLAERL